MGKAGKVHRFLTYFIKNFLPITLAILVPVLIMISVIFSLQSLSHQEDVIQTGKKDLIQIQTKIDEQLIAQSTANMQTANKSQVLRLLSGPLPVTTESSLRSLRELQAYLQVVRLSNPLLDNITIFYDEPRYYVSEHSAWSYAPPQYATTEISTLLDKHYGSAVQSTTSFFDNHIYQCTNILRNGSPRGCVIFRSSSHNLQRALQNAKTSPKDILLLLTKDEKIITGSLAEKESFPTQVPTQVEDILDVLQVAQYQGNVSINKNNYHIITEASDYDEMSYVLLYSLDGRLSKKPVEILVFSLAMGTIVMLALSLAITWKLYHPLIIIIEMLNNPELTMSNQYKSLLDRMNELGIISSLIQESRLNQLMVEHQLFERKMELDAMSSKALRAQINPHFIYNTLESVNWKAMSLLGLDNDISVMLGHFSNLLRLTFRDTAQLVSLHEELAHAKLYILLQQYRYKDKFSIHWEIPTAAQDYLVVPLLFQPLLENSLEHGGKGKSEHAPLNIHCRVLLQENLLLVEVEDNGSGFSPEKLKEIRKLLKDDGPYSPNYIGLCNTNRRIQLSFGNSYGIAIQSEPNLKTIVTVTLPHVK